MTLTLLLRPLRLLRIRRRLPISVIRQVKSPTPRIYDAGSRLLNFLFRKLSVSLIQSVADSPYR